MKFKTFLRLYLGKAVSIACWRPGGEAMRKSDLLDAPEAPAFLVRSGSIS
jgi:hypothetical protein